MAAAKAKGPDLKRLAALVVTMRERHEELGLLLVEFDAMLEGKPTIAAKLKACEAGFSEAWESRYLTPYVWNYVKNRAQWKRLLVKLTPAELTARAVGFLANDDPFYTRGRHSFDMFVATVNQHAPPAVVSSWVPTWECRQKHGGECRSEAEHTERYEQDMTSR